MRVLKFLAKLIVAFLAVALTFGILFFLMPAWQKAAIEEALSHDQDRRWQISSVEMGPTRIEANGLYVLDGLVGLEIGRLEAKGPFWFSPISGVIEIESGRIQGFNLDASRLRVGDLTSKDWQSFLKRISTDADFWEQRAGVLLQKLSATGWEFSMTDVLLEGSVLMPGETLVPVTMKIIQADSRGGIQPRIKLLPGQPDKSL